ncbi:MAG TPA: ABC transporter substrate-binding protein [Stellaceae bacterium]|jgi:ABC-type nitrate/sulfonate/bicarbonate transport system substrate-binding protein
MRAKCGLGALAALVLGLIAPAAIAQQTIETGLIGSPQAGGWPYYIGIEKGFFAAAGVKLDVIYVPTASGLVQQLAAGSLDVVNIGIVEPIHAVARGAPVAIVRVTGNVPPYDVVARPEIKTVQDLKGHTVVIGGLIDINRVYLERVLKAAGLEDSDIEITVIGNTAGRYAAIKSNAAQATMLVPPFNFVAETAGFTNLGTMMQFAGDLPFGSTDVSLAFAKQHRDALIGFVSALDKSIAWFNDDANRAAAIDLLASVMTSPNRAEIAKSYDFFRKIGYFSNDNAISRKKLDSLMDEMTAIGDTDGRVPIEKLILPGISKVGE